MLLLGDVASGLYGRDVRFGEWLAARVLVDQLDRALAGGKTPETSARLALRAQELVRPTTLRRFAARLERHLEEAQQPDRFFLSARVPARRKRVVESEAAIRVLIERLRGAGLASARGAALVSVLLHDGSGPLYGQGSTRSLSAQIDEAIEALNSICAW